MATKKARKRSKPVEPLPERICPVCGKKFIPKTNRAIYDRPSCRVQAVELRRKQTAWLAELNGDLERLRQGLPDTARRVEEMTRAHGLEVGRAALALALASAKEFKDLYNGAPRTRHVDKQLVQ